MQLGPFILDRILGQGGMGAVWRAVHATQGVPVALKIDLHPPAPESTAAFLHEVQIVAALDHPNVVMVLDHGVVDAEVERASGGGLRAGSRWLAMELAGGGTAADLAPRDWSEVRHLTRGLLDGLAHAHARGVIHRDIKPANALLAGDEASVATVPASLLAARVVLSDFGISERRDHTALRTEDSVGTPHYMAPEQIEARFRDQGPWTDLYAVGILLWRLATREFPFAGKNAFAIFRQHLAAPPGPFRPAMAVPDGLEDLCRSLLQKAPGDRPAFAADVRRSLDALGEPVRGGETAWPSVEDVDDEATVTHVPLTSSRTYGGRSKTRAGGVPSLHEGRRINVQLHGAGLALYGLRTTPFVGREREGDQLWSALVAVRAEGRARVVAVRGPAGIGKSRLVDWLSTRAHELGVGSTLRAVHAVGAPPGAGLVGMLHRELGTEGLDADEVLQRLDEIFADSSFDRHALGRLLHPPEGVRPPRGVEARQLVLAALAELTRHRPRVVVLEDAHLDLEALAFVDALLTMQSLVPRPVLVLLTVRDEALTDHPDVEELLDELVEDPYAEALPLGPLDGDGRRALVRGLLGLDGALAHTVEERTAGNPMFANQVIGAWVEQGVLVPGPRGFQLAPAVQPEIPADLGHAWRTRLDAALQGRSSAQIEAIEVASALGATVDDADWRATCALLGLAPSDELLAALLKRHLVHAEDDERRSWRFSHGLLREALADRSRAAGHWTHHHLAAAVHLRERGRARPVQLARHLLEAEVWDEAVDPLIEAIVDQTDTGDVRSVELLNQLEQVFGRLRIRAPHPLWTRLAVLKATRHRARGELKEAAKLAESAVGEARTQGSEIAARALREAARTRFALGNLDDALARAVEAEQAFLAIDDRVRAADCSYTAAEVLSASGRFAEAAQRLEGCIAVFEREGKDYLHSALISMATVEHRRGDLEATARWLSRCRAHAEPLGLQWTLAQCANIEGELARAQGDLVSAAELYREAADRYRAMESPDFAYPLLNLCILDALAGRWDVALQRLHPLRVHLDKRPHAMVQAYADVVSAAANAGLGDAPAAWTLLERLAAYLDRSGFVDPDIAVMAERAAGELLKAGHREEATRAIEIAESQFNAAKRPDDAQRVRSMVA